MIQDRPPAANAPSTANRADATNRPLSGRVRSLSLSDLPDSRAGIWTYLIWAAVLACLAGGGWYAYRVYGPGGLALVAQSASSTASAPTPNAASPKSQPAAGSAASEPSKSGHPAASSAPAVHTPGKGEVILESKGYIVPAHQILVSPKVSGMIVMLNVEEGRRVEKGSILAVLESIDYQADCDRAKANVRLMQEKLRELENGNRPEEIKEAEAELRENEAQLVQLEAEYKRTEDLRKRNSVTQQDLELALSKFLAQRQRVTRLEFAHSLMKLGPRAERIEVARAELAQSEADVKKAEWRLNNCTIRAAISGTILKKNAEEGNIVNPIAFNGSFSLCDMADLSDLEVDLNIQERDISVVAVGQKCRIRAEAYNDRIYEGRVDRLMPIADRAKGAIPVRVKIRIPTEEEGIYLKPEMGAIVTFLNEQAVQPAGVALGEPPADTTPTEIPVSTQP